MSVANDIEPLHTIAGHAFTVRERAGGLLRLRVSLHGGTMAEFALRLRALGGVRVVKGPEALVGCYIAHCAGFKIVLSTDEADDAASALVSPTPGGTAEPIQASDLSALLAGLMRKPTERPSDTSPWRKGFVFGKASVAGRLADGTGSSRLRRTALAPGKPLSRKTPLRRKAPFGRGGGKRR
jgi:hypothetical protein